MPSLRLSTSRPLLEAAILGLALIGFVAGGADRREREPAVPEKRLAVLGDRRLDAGTVVVAPPSRRWKAVLLNVYDGINRHRVLLVAAGVAFFALLALFPAIASLVALFGFFADPAAINEHVSALRGIVPADALDIVHQEIERVISQGQGTLSLLFFSGLAISLWSAMSGIKAICDALNIVHEETEKRSFLMLNLQALLFTLAALLFVGLALGAIVLVPVVVALLGIDDSMLPALRWPLMYAVILLGLAALYRFGPSHGAGQWRWITWGSAIAGALWLFGSMLFSWYVSSFANYNKTYGSLGAVIAFMTWIWLSVTIILIGAEIDAAIEQDAARARKSEPSAPAV